MKRIFLFAAIIFMAGSAFGQLLAPANGGSSKAWVGERIGITDVGISYGRPAVKGREGHVWGGLVYTGFQNAGFGNPKGIPWRAGANENTIIEFSTNVLVEGHSLPAGKYGFFVAYGPAACTLIFSSATSSWGSFSYDDKEDVLRVDVKPVPLAESKERLTYEFSNETDSSAVISLEWEKLAIPFTVSTRLQELQMASYENELRGQKGFDPHALAEVAGYMQEHNIKLEDALEYARNAATAMPGFGTLMTESEILAKLNRKPQADSIAKDAMSKGTAQEVHGYARRLLRENRKQEAFDIFQYNYKQHPNIYTTNVGLMRGYAAIGKTKDALKYASLALPQAPDAANKKAVEDAINTLKAGKEL